MNKPNSPTLLVKVTWPKPENIRKITLGSSDLDGDLVIEEFFVNGEPFGRKFNIRWRSPFVVKLRQCCASVALVAG